MATCLPLVEHITGLADPRGKRGRRHPLVAMLSLAIAATLCGAQGYCAMAEWGCTQGAEMARALGFTRAQTPCAATFYLLFRRLDRQALEACLGRWVAQVLAALPPTEAGGPPGLAIDGKTLRGSRKQGAPLTHILSAVSHRLGLTLGQVAVDDKTNEMTAIHTLLRGLLLQGQVVTMDALLTQQKSWCGCRRQRGDDQLEVVGTVGAAVRISVLKVVATAMSRVTALKKITVPVVLNACRKRPATTVPSGMKPKARRR